MPTITIVSSRIRASVIVAAGFVPNLAWANTPVGATLILQAVLIVPLLISLIFVRRKYRLMAATAFILVVLGINYLIIAEINDVIFWVSLALPYFILLISFQRYLKGRRRESKGE